MLKFLWVLHILFLSVSIYCQNTNLHNKKDSLDNKTGLYLKYDIEHIKLSETMFANNEAVYTNYFSRKGDTIVVYDWAINVTAIKKIREHILRNFVINEFTEASGSAVLLLILDIENDLYEIRVIRGITQGFNNELLRAINKVEKDLIFVCTTDCKMPIVTPFAIRLNE
jgi:hypothetical protein